MPFGKLSGLKNLLRKRSDPDQLETVKKQAGSQNALTAEE